MAATTKPGMARGTKQEAKIRAKQADLLLERVAAFANEAEPGDTWYITDDDLDRFHIGGLHILNGKRGASYRLRYYDAEGKRRVATLGRFPAMSPVDAVEKARQWLDSGDDPLARKEQERLDQLAALREKEEEERRAQQRTLGEYLDVYERRVLSRKRAGREEAAWVRHAFADWLDRDMATITSADVEKWQHQKEDEGRAHDTLRRVYGALKKVFKHAATKGNPPMLEANPLANVHLDKPKADSERETELRTKRQQTRRLLTPKEQSGIVAGLWAREDDIREHPRNRKPQGDGNAVTFQSWFTPFTLMAMATGMRPGDLYHLRWGVDLSVTFGRLHFTPRKTEHHKDPAEVTMPIREPLLGYMKAWHRQLGSPKDGTLVFPSKYNQANPMDKKAHSGPWKQVKKFGGLPDDLTFYSLRHHFIGRMLSDGKAPTHVAALVGHKSTAMIESHYRHLCPSSTDAVLASFLETLPDMDRPGRGEPAAKSAGD